MLTVAAWTLLAAVVVRQQMGVGGRVFGLGLGVTAYTLGVRHAFDADHIAAVDNTRQLLRTGRRPVSVGFWFALGPSTVVVLLAAGVAAGACAVPPVLRIAAQGDDAPSRSGREPSVARASDPGRA